MDEKDKQILRDIQIMTEENNRILKKMNRRAFYSSISSLLYWTVIIITAYGAYYFIEPYVAKMTNLYNTVANSEILNADLHTVKTVTDVLGKVIPNK